MAAAKLVTRCPACRTAFRLVADQLRLRQGLVRCGHCETVFDAREHLIEVPAPATSAAAPSPHRQSEPSAPASAPVDTEFEATPASSAAVFDPGYDPGYDVPALDSPTMMMAPAEDEEEAPFDVEDDAVRDPASSWAEPEAEPAPHGIAQPALQEALPEAPAEIHGGHPEETAGEDTELQPTQPEAAEAAQATEASAVEPEAEPHYESQPERESVEAEQPEVGPVAAANGVHHAEQDAPHEAPESAAIVTAHAPWPTLDRSAFEDEEPAPAAPDVVQAGAQEDAADEPASEPHAGSPAEPVLRSASEFLRAQSSDSTEVPALADAAPTTYEAGHETHRGYGRDGHEGDDADHESAHASGHEAGPDDGRNLGPTYGPSPGEAFSATAGAIARENATRRWAREEPQMGPAFAPDFLRQARERERERAREVAAPPAPPRFRYGWHIAAGVLALGVVMQGMYLMRGQLAGHFPALRPVLEAACAPLGCDVPPWRDIDALRIDTSQLQKQEEGSDAYLLAVTLRNQGRATTALPAIELVMTDLQDQLLLRRVLEPSEYLEPAQKTFATHGLRAGMELPVRVRFRTQQAAANYRVLIFYP
ncbi:zinc-ribbon and DUF3426 domain-containing protein [Cupriavidus pinatubonensis]|uniref:Zinc finger/thioredoxin putative domain-containing protein n=1 Tax=Cupriavidus pinatubonensis TaxID=248026 RepID=A0ABN7Z7U3_9BURK|nr:zinc-ribbon and DUF3426 domain-containing protein [Cupriavidus pinatubonensis]CAG9181308.1 hypothetical protein LMG23994_04644 [Cupriavidus pinatubonensis]